MPGPIRDFGFQAPVDFGTVRPERQAPVAVRELEVLRLDQDVVAPADAAELAEPLVEIFQGAPTSGDHLRLPQMSQLDGARMRAAVGRVLAVDTSAPTAVAPEALEQEARMREVLRALDHAVEHIQRRSTGGAL